MAKEIDPSPTEYYHLAVSYRPAPHAELHQAEIARFTDPDLGPVIAYDAAQDPEACRVILNALLGGRRLRSPDSEARFNTAAESALSADLEPRLFTGQQSNTSVMLGESAILKLFRRLELGHNLDIEVHAALNAARISDVAGLYGWIEGSWVSGGRQLDADLAMVIEKLAGARDGWGAGTRLAARENASTKIATVSGFAADAEALGRALAEIHHALRSSFSTTKMRGARTAMIMIGRLQEAASIAPALANTFRVYGVASTSSVTKRWIRSAYTATFTSVRRCAHPWVGRSSTLKASRRRLWRNAVLRTRFGETSPACFALLITRQRACPDRRAQPGRPHVVLHSCTATPLPIDRYRSESAARVRGRQGDLRGRLRDAEPARLDRYSARRTGRVGCRRSRLTRFGSVSDLRR